MNTQADWIDALSWTPYQRLWAAVIVRAIQDYALDSANVLCSDYELRDAENYIFNLDKGDRLKMHLSAFMPEDQLEESILLVQRRAIDYRTFRRSRGRLGRDIRVQRGKL